MEHFRNNIFFYILISTIVVIGVISYNRFIVNQDYLVGYEGVCDPVIEKCFIGCEDDSCTKQYYYSEVLKYAPDLYKECGKDITDCEAASICLPDDRKCSITYCEEGVDGNICATSIEESSVPDDNPVEFIEEEFLEDINSDNIL